LTSPKNLLFILSDQHTRSALGCYGHPQLRTPHLDALAARGTRFSNAYCNSPICVPSRAVLATGQYVFQTGYWDNAKPYEGAVPSWGHWLRQRDHRVESIGKLHFRSAADPCGFDREQIPMHVVGGSGDLLGSLRTPGVVLSKYRSYLDEAGPGDTTYIRYDRDIADHAVRWLEQQATVRHERPWVLFVSLVCPHPPIIAPPEFYAWYPPAQVPWPKLYDSDWHDEHPALAEVRRFLNLSEPFSEQVVRRSIAAYFGLCSYLDASVGRILAALEANGLSDSTRVLYSSDHGESNGDRGIWGKCHMYEESLGIPMIFAGADVPAGAVVDTPVTLADCFPTVLEATGIDTAEVAPSLAGHSLFDLAAGAQAQREVFAEYHAAGSTTASFMLRRGDIKYVHHVAHPDQLFDLAGDPDEAHDLIEDARYRSELGEMRRRLYELVDPLEVDARARRDQAARIAAAGGRDAILERGSFGYTPAPGETVVYKT
jgi:choline-sulfatase